MKPALLLRLFAIALLVMPLVGCDPTKKKDDAGGDGSWIEIRGTRVELELAITQQEMALGLGKRDGLAWNHGMLFVYEDPGFYSFWMKDMRFSIDILWLRDGRIVEIYPRVPFYPGDPGPSLRPRSLADMVLEVPAGYSEAHGWKLGDKAKLHLGPEAVERLSR